MTETRRPLLFRGVKAETNVSLCYKASRCRQDHWKNWYEPDDFKDMKESGLNSVRLPVGWWYFAAKSAISREPYSVPDEDLYEKHHPITDVIRWAK